MGTRDLNSGTDGCISALNNTCQLGYMIPIQIIQFFYLTHVQSVNFIGPLFLQSKGYFPVREYSLARL